MYLSTVDTQRISKMFNDNIFHLVSDVLNTDLAQYPLVTTVVLLNFPLVLLKHWQNVVKVRERSWSWFNTEKVYWNS